MVLDKLQWLRLENFAGMGFVVWGLANLGIYGLSLVMHKENFNYHFAYTGSGKATQPLKALMGAETLNNVAWTAPSLILGGLYLNSKVGSLTAMKIFSLSVFASYAAVCTMGPATQNSHLNLRHLMPIRWDSIDTE